MEINLFDEIKAIDIANKTANAFMYEIYGREEWVKCIVFMIEQDLSIDKIKRILRSKHMRWTIDYGYGFDDVQDISAATFRRYYFSDIILRI